MMGYIFQTSTDSEIIAALIAQNLKRRKREVAGQSRKISSKVLLHWLSPQATNSGSEIANLYPAVVHRPHEVRCNLFRKARVFPLQGAEVVRDDVEPGEIVVIQNNELRSIRFNEEAPKKVCSFEYVYFARTDSRMDGRSVHHARREAGRILARESGVEVICDRRSGLRYGSGDRVCGRVWIPFGEGLVKNRYVGRTFIQPTQEMRELGVRMKLNVPRKM